jgi:hypothetical protein
MLYNTLHCIATDLQEQPLQHAVQVRGRRVPAGDGPGLRVRGGHRVGATGQRQWRHHLLHRYVWLCYMLCYASRPWLWGDIVWERLDSVNGDTTFCTGTCGYVRCYVM